MNLLSHAVTERAIDVLVTGDTRLAFERRAYDQRLEMPAIAGYLDHFAFEAIRDVALYVARRGFHWSYLMSRHDRERGQAAACGCLP